MIRTAQLAHYISNKLDSMFDVDSVTCVENDLFCVRAYPTPDNFDKVREFFDRDVCEWTWYVSEDKWSITYALADRNHIRREIAFEMNRGDMGC